MKIDDYSAFLCGKMLDGEVYIVDIMDIVQ